MSELELYKKMYLSLFKRTDEVIEYINCKMMIPGKYDWDHVREILLKLQAAHQECEDIYVDGEDG